MRKMQAIVVLALALTLSFAGAAKAVPVLDRIQKKGELVVGTSGDLETMAEHWFNDASWLSELP